MSLLIGGLVSSLGQLISAFATDVGPMYFSFGLLTGKRATVFSYSVIEQELRHCPSQYTWAELSIQLSLHCSPSRKGACSINGVVTLYPGVVGVSGVAMTIKGQRNPLDIAIYPIKDIFIMKFFQLRLIFISIGHGNGQG